MHTITANRTSEIVTVRFHGRVAIADRNLALDEVLPLLEQTGYRQILADVRNVEFVIGDFDASNRFASRLAFQARLRCCQTAYLTSVGAHVDPVVEALSAARGFVSRRFDDRTLAIQWLLGFTTLPLRHYQAAICAA